MREVKLEGVSAEEKSRMSKLVMSVRRRRERKVKDE